VLFNDTLHGSSVYKCDRRTCIIVIIIIIIIINNEVTLFNTVRRQKTASQQQQSAAHNELLFNLAIHTYRNATLTAPTDTKLFIIKLTGHQI
jgi:hypothetical protein